MSVRFARVLFHPRRTVHPHSFRVTAGTRPVEGPAIGAPSHGANIARCGAFAATFARDEIVARTLATRSDTALDATATLDFTLEDPTITRIDESTTDRAVVDAFWS